MWADIQTQARQLWCECGYLSTTLSALFDDSCQGKNRGLFRRGRTLKWAPSIRRTEHLSMYFWVRDISKSVERLALILQISIPHDINSTWLDLLNYVAMTTISFTWLVYVIVWKHIQDLAFISHRYIPHTTQKVKDRETKRGLRCPCWNLNFVTS